VDQVKPHGCNWFLSTGIGTLKRNPVIWAVVLAYSLASAGLAGLQLIDPLFVLAGYAVLLFVVPFYLGGIIGTVEEGLRGSATVGRFFSRWYVELPVHLRRESRPGYHHVRPSTSSSVSSD